MVLQLHPALPSDAPRIATIHLKAFNSNPLLHAQFPTPASLAARASNRARETAHEIENEKDGKAVWVVRDTEAEEGEEVEEKAVEEEENPEKEVQDTGRCSPR